MSKKTILISGGTGLIGSRLQQLLPSEKYNIYLLTRSPRSNHDNIQYFKWNPTSFEIDDGAVEVDCIINLAGAGIASSRWTKAYKKIIVESRTKSLDTLQKALFRTKHRPKCIISASAVGYYGNRGEEILDENSSPGHDFMAQTCAEWENAAQNLNDLTDRLSILRIGIVLSTQGGALEKMLITKALRVLSYFGNGSQFYSWIHIDDLCRMIIQILEDQYLQGIFNGTSPKPLTNKEFTQELADGLNGNFLVLPAPALGLKLALGEGAAVVLNSTRVIPRRFLEADFKFKYTELASAIADLIDTKI